MSASSQGVQTWIDKCALAELLSILSAAVDRRDRDAIADCYAESSYDDHGLFKGTGREFADMIRASEGPAEEMVMHHMLGQSVFDVSDHEAWGETFFVMHAVTDGQMVSGFGRYVDYFRRIDTKWKIVYRRVVPDATIPGDDLRTYWQSHPDHFDPRYDRLRWPPLQP